MDSISAPLPAESALAATSATALGAWLLALAPAVSMASSISSTPGRASRSSQSASSRSHHAPTPISSWGRTALWSRQPFTTGHPLSVKQRMVTMGPMGSWRRLYSAFAQVERTLSTTAAGTPASTASRPSRPRSTCMASTWSICA